jgi:hypothetical protein
MEWAKTLMMNSCDSLLAERIDEKFEDLRQDEQGGVTYIKLALDEMFTVSNTVVQTLQGFFENFAKEGIAKVPNEDVRHEQILAVAERLAEVSALPTEVTVQILEGFTRCSVLIFKQTFSHLLVGERLKQLCTITCLSLHDNTRLGGIKTLCKEANDMFNSLNISKEWNIPQARRNDALIVPCFNCGDPKHGVPKCPKPLDQARIDKAKSEFVKNGGGRKERSNTGFRYRANVRHLSTHFISPQFHLVFDDSFETANGFGISGDAVEPIYNELFQLNRKLFSEEELDEAGDKVFGMVTTMILLVLTTVTITTMILLVLTTVTTTTMVLLVLTLLREPLLRKHSLFQVTSTTMSARRPIVRQDDALMIPGLIPLSSSNLKY